MSYPPWGPGTTSEPTSGVSDGQQAKTSGLNSSAAQPARGSTVLSSNASLQWPDPTFDTTVYTKLAMGDNPHAVPIVPFLFLLIRLSPVSSLFNSAVEQELTGIVMC